jgi:hypothetical protein
MGRSRWPARRGRDVSAPTAPPHARPTVVPWFGGWRGQGRLRRRRQRRCDRPPGRLDGAHRPAARADQRAVGRGGVLLSAGAGEGFGARRTAGRQVLGWRRWRSRGWRRRWRWRRWRWLRGRGWRWRRWRWLPGRGWRLDLDVPARAGGGCGARRSGSREGLVQHRCRLPDGLLEPGHGHLGGLGQDPAHLLPRLVLGARLRIVVRGPGHVGCGRWSGGGSVVGGPAQRGGDDVVGLPAGPLQHVGPGLVGLLDHGPGQLPCRLLERR